MIIFLLNATGEEILTKIELNFFGKMEADSVQTILKKYFSKSDKADWEKIATQELGGKNPFENLLWRGKDDILFLPYYDTSKDADLHFLKGFQLAAGENSHKRFWFNLPRVKTSNPEIANALALDHLLQGADGIAFDLCNIVLPNLNKLMHNIEWPHCYISFLLNDDPNALQSIIHLIENKYDPGSLQGALFWESIPKKSNPTFYFNGNKKIKTLGLVIGASTPAAEISHALIEGLKCYEKFSSDEDPRNVFSEVCFSLPADASLLETVSKFKALRMLWFQVANAYGHTDYNSDDLIIHARVADVADASYAPRENMLRGTFAAMAAILGGCNSLTIESNDHDDVHTRWSRNVSSILREESFFDKTADPLAGAWAIDAITNDIASKAWEMFQEKWKSYVAS